MEVPKKALILYNPTCFQEGLFWGNFGPNTSSSVQGLNNIAPSHPFHLKQLIQWIARELAFELYNSSGDQVPYKVAQNINKWKFILLSHLNIFNVLWTPRIRLHKILVWVPRSTSSIKTSLPLYIQLHSWTNSKVSTINVLQIAPTSINP